MTTTTLATLDADLRDIFDDWTIIRTRTHLRGAILYAARLMRRAGDTERADEWTARASRMPRHISKEAINLVLWSICDTLKGGVA